MNVMLAHQVLPIVNENDTVCITELMFTDNDELSGLISELMDSQALVILSNVDGIYDGDPAKEGTKVIREVHAGDSLASYLQNSHSSSGRGGMKSKCQTAFNVSNQGLHVMIANGKTPDILTRLLLSDEDVIHTHFNPKTV